MPSIFVHIILWMISISGYSLAWIIWWTMFLQSRWRLLAVDGRGILEILCDPNPEFEVSKRDQMFLHQSWWPALIEIKYNEVAEEIAEKNARRMLEIGYLVEVDLRLEWRTGAGGKCDDVITAGRPTRGFLTNGQPE
jgi:hypothetical protein